MCSPTGTTRLITSRNMRWRDVWQCGGEGKCMLCLVGKPEGKRSFGRPGRRWKKTLKWVVSHWDGVSWTGFIWLWIAMSGWSLWKHGWSSGFQKARGISGVTWLTLTVVYVGKNRPSFAYWPVTDVFELKIIWAEVQYWFLRVGK